MSTNSYREGKKRALERLSAFNNGTEKWDNFPYMARVRKYLRRVPFKDHRKAQEVLACCVARNGFSDQGDILLELEQINGWLWEAYEDVATQWSSRNTYFVCGFLYEMLNYPQLWYYEENPPLEDNDMAGEAIFHPHTVLVVSQTGTRRVQFDPAYFELKKGDHVVLPYEGKDTSYVLGVVHKEPEPYSTSSGAGPLPLVVDRVDVEQYKARMERQGDIDKARMLLREAIKRNTEQDLFEQARGKLTPEEREFIASTLGLKAPTDGDDKQG